MYKTNIRINFKKYMKQIFKCIKDNQFQLNEDRFNLGIHHHYDWFAHDGTLAVYIDPKIPLQKAAKIAQAFIELTGIASIVLKHDGVDGADGELEVSRTHPYIK